MVASTVPWSIYSRCRWAALILEPINQSCRVCDQDIKKPNMEGHVIDHRWRAAYLQENDEQTTIHDLIEKMREY